MKHDTHTRIHDIEGSTDYHGAFPARKACMPQVCDGGSVSVPHENNTLSMPKPAVLESLLPDPSRPSSPLRRTHGTAIRADYYPPGVVRSRLPGRSGGGAFWVKLGVACEQLHRKYLAVPMLTLAYMLMLRYLQLLIGIIPVRPEIASPRAAYPYGVTEQIIHDCRFAVFRRRAVGQRLGASWPIAKPPRRGQPVTD